MEEAQGEAATIPQSATSSQAEHLLLSFRLSQLPATTTTTTTAMAARGGITSHPDLLSVNFNQDSTCDSQPPTSRAPTDDTAPTAASQQGRGRAIRSPTAIRLERSTARVSLLSRGRDGGSCELGWRLREGRVQCGRPGMDKGAYALSDRDG